MCQPLSWTQEVPGGAVGGGGWVGNAKGSTSYGAEFFPIGYLVYTVPQLCLSAANLTLFPYR